LVRLFVAGARYSQDALILMRVTPSLRAKSRPRDCLIGLPAMNTESS
jgi:hypothetical protein